MNNLVNIIYLYCVLLYLLPMIVKNLSGFSFPLNKVLQLISLVVLQFLFLIGNKLVYKSETSSVNFMMTSGLNGILLFLGLSIYNDI